METNYRIEFVNEGYVPGTDFTPTSLGIGKENFDAFTDRLLKLFSETENGATFCRDLLKDGLTEKEVRQLAFLTFVSIRTSREVQVMKKMIDLFRGEL